MARLGDVCEKRIDIIKATYTGDIDYIDISSIDNKSKKITEIQSISIVDAPSRAKQLVFPGDILVSTVRPNLNAVALVTESADNTLVASTGYCVLRCLPNTYNKYVFYFCQSPAFIEKMVTQATGASYPAVTSSIVKECTIPLPPLEEQRRIAALLDKVSDLIAKRRAQLDKLDLLVKARFVEMFGDPINNSKKLPTILLGEACFLKAGITTAADTIHDQSEEYPIPCYGGNGIRGFVKEATQQGSYPIIGRQGALCGNVQLATGKFHATEHAVLVSPLIETNVLWLYYLLRFMNLYRYHTGAAQPGLAVKTLNEVEIPLAKIDQQNRFAIFVEQNNKSKLTIQQSLDKLETLKKALMQQYFG